MGGLERSYVGELEQAKLGKDYLVGREGGRERKGEWEGKGSVLARTLKGLTEARVWGQPLFLLPPSITLLLPVPILEFCFSTVWSGPHVELIVRGRGSAAGGG